MKKYILSAVPTIFGSLVCLSQVPVNYNADNESFGMQPMLQYAFQQLSSKAVKDLKEIDIVGSRYLSDEFTKTAIYSEGGLEGYTYSRYDGHNEEVQLKENINDSEVSILLRRADIYCVVNNTAIVFRKYYDKSGKLKRGHLFKLMETDNITLYERRLKRFKEGKEAANSLQMSVKNRFVEDSELYYLNKGEEKIQFLKTTKKGIVGLFKGDIEKAAAVKQYISDQNINVKEVPEILKVLSYSETL